jgi:hypothetical protein
LEISVCPPFDFFATFRIKIEAAMSHKEEYHEVFCLFRIARAG